MKDHPDARLIVMSPPGCGGSDPLVEAGADISDTIEVLALAVIRMDLTLASVAGEGAGAVLAEMLLDRLGSSLSAEWIDPPAWLTGSAALPSGPLLTASAPAWDGSHLTSAWFQLRDLQLYDVPPGAGVVARRSGSETPEVARLDRLFRSYVQGPEGAVLLGQVVAHVRSRQSAGSDFTRAS